MTAPTGRPRGRPRKNLLPVAPVPGPEPAADGVENKPKPKKEPAQRLSAAYFAEKLRSLREADESSFAEGSGGIKNIKERLELIKYEAEMNGIRTADILDQRSELQVADEFLERAMRGETDGWRAFDEELDAMERAFEVLSETSKRTILDDLRAEDVKALSAMIAEKADKLGKTWGDRIRRLRKIRKAARNPVPPGTREEDRHSEAAMHCLRYALYVMRSNISDRVTAGGASAYLDIRQHHINMAWTIYRARNNLRVSNHGLVPCGFVYEGVLLILPPGHGKTTIAFANLGLQISLRPYTQLLCGHANATLASANLRYLAHLFSDENPAGQRNIALFPAIRLDSVSEKRMRLKTKEKSKSSTSAAYGIHSKLGGVDANEIWFDDPVDPSEREQPEQRRRTYELMVGQWSHRLRGKRGFKLTTATLWHDDDANGRQLEMIRKSKLNVAVYMHACGGPETSPPFQAIWPEMYPAERLRAMYAADPAIYAAAYMCDPRPESLQIIKKLRYYDPSSPQHLEFKRGATFYVSLDPSATTNAKSDKAGVVYGGFGVVTGEADGKKTSEYRLRIEGAKQMLATQSDLVQHVCNFAFSSRVDEVLFENVSGYMGFGEMLQNELGIVPIGMPTGNRSKEVRLRQVAGMLEHTIPDGPEGAKVFGGAVVEFPGIRNEDGSVGPDPSLQWFYDQILKYGTVRDKGCLDATTQLIWHLVNVGDLVGGAGRVTDIIRTNVVNAKDDRIKAMLKQMLKPPVERDPHEEEADFFGYGSQGHMELEMQWNN